MAKGIRREGVVTEPVGDLDPKLMPLCLYYEEVGSGFLRNGDISKKTTNFILQHGLMLRREFPPIGKKCTYTYID